MLPDLRSRLGNLTIYQLPRFDDAEIEALLAFRAARRGITLAPDVLSYLLARAPRSVPAIMSLLEELDREGLARGRAITVPLIASLKLVSMDP
jgi:DnaA family protein